jgi:integrase/recombinase XerD
LYTGWYKNRVYNPCVPLSIYRRHSVDCRVHKLRLKAYEKKYFKDCDCPIWLTGSTDTERYPRQALGVRDWPAAEAKLRSLNAESKDETVHGLKLDECITRYLDARDDVKPKTLAQYKLLLGRLKDFAHGKNKFFVRELSVDVLEDFKTYGLAGLAGTSKGTSIAKLAHFLREAYRRGWIAESLVDKMRRHKAVYEQKQPYSEKEVKLILDAAGKINGGTTGYAKSAATFRLLVELMLETGLRVSDAVKFDPKRCVKSKYLWTYSFHPRKAKKNDAPKLLDVYLTAKLKKKIDECEWLSDALPFAYRAVSGDEETDYLGQAVYERLQAVGKACGVDDCRPHRLRDTFAVGLLTKGVPLEDVSKLLGHASVAVTEKYYAPWVASRKLRLERLLSETLANAKGN